MNHIGTITKSAIVEGRFHAQCSCGPSGHFPTKEQAASFLQGHFSRLGGISTYEMRDDSDKPILNAPHVGGVGTMPATHATQPSSSGPPAPPPPPDSETK